MTAAAPTVGIVGGGQLGRMLALAGVPLGVRCICVEPAPDPPAAAAGEVIAAPFGDREALAVLADRCDVVTVELEHVDVDALGWLAERVPVRPAPPVIAAVQDRLLEKAALQRAGVPTAPHADALAGPEGFAAGSVVKRRTGGFDGRGQQLLGPHASAAEVVQAVAGLGAPCVVEEVVAFDRELSIVAARGVDGTVACYPAVENVHLDGVLRRTVAPAPGADHAAATELARHLLESWDYVGVMAVELFDVGGSLVANEVAPRVHNSGHWTIEGSVTSQFEQHLRAVLGWPLGDTTTLGAAGMVNLVGGWPEPAAVLALPGAHLHLYGKAPRPGRKVGHVTVVAPTADERDERLAAVEDLVRSWPPRGSWT